MENHAPAGLLHPILDNTGMMAAGVVEIDVDPTLRRISGLDGGQQLTNALISRNCNQSLNCA